MRYLVLLSVGLLVALTAACGDDDDNAPSPTFSPILCPSATTAGMFSYSPKVTFGDTSLFVEVADTRTERQTGLMNRACLGDNSGMLFVYPQDVENTFWMKETLIPLSIAWVKADGTVLGVDDMAPQTEDLHAPPAPYRYAIEANQGWFTQHGIAAGDQATLPPNLSAS